MRDNTIVTLERPEQVNVDPAPVERVVGRKVVPSEYKYHWCNFGGSYGMGGPGFFGLFLEAANEFPAEWLMLCLWGSDDWLTVGERWLGALPGQYKDDESKRPLCSNFSNAKWDEFGPMVLNQTITKFEVHRDHCELVVGDAVIRLDQDPEKRPYYAGNNRPRLVPPDHDLRKGAWKLVNTVSVAI